MSTHRESKTQSAPRPVGFNAPRSVRVWIGLVCLILVALITIGGITRLTGSGLSITDWKPIMGAIPPLNEADWNEAFTQYQEIPQFKLVNHQMTLSEFKGIFFWEWLHRFIARTIGFAVIFPALYFWIRKKISTHVLGRALTGFFMGGLQGLLGWFMVMSGLSERVSVSHFRLAAHFGLALIILSYFTWLLRDLQTKRTALDSEWIETASKIRPLYHLYTALLVFQIVYGAFVAGLKAGWGFNTWPKMNGEWIPSSFFGLEGGFWMNVLSNPASVHWIHRTNGILLFAASFGLWIVARRTGKRGELRRITTVVSHATMLQFMVGVLTVLFVIPLPLAVLHQFFAALLVVLGTTFGHTLSRISTSPASKPFSPPHPSASF